MRESTHGDKRSPHSEQRSHRRRAPTAHRPPARSPTRLARQMVGILHLRIPVHHPVHESTRRPSGHQPRTKAGRHSLTPNNNQTSTENEAHYLTSGRHRPSEGVGTNSPRSNLGADHALGSTRTARIPEPAEGLTTQDAGVNGSRRSCPKRGPASHLHQRRR